ncbi:NPCBM/NEW2 domain-containing protein [Sphingomonas sp. H39-1-10]|uniref:NPCBM/NEW2 domain-containing protein n=1 Tax=Sphingomonas pollutisoli TaxID=3030829 RepID=UPI0023B992D3|nr:NPCBM/NEW2 domain-containing protein [Sphingomonas pollutisoli]MDF0488939.1 NPCBM/NEW2 domain-containing protein [Sphingomonas pollutisoli]
MTQRLSTIRRLRTVFAATSALIASVAAQQAAAQVAPLEPSGQFSAYPSAAAQTPPMGWNPWNAFRTDVDEAKVRASAQALVDTGLAAKGYRYVNIDDGWALKRLPDGRLRIRDSMFPSSKVAGSDAGSFLPFTAFLHGLGLKAGLYTDIGRNTCAQRWDADSRNLPEGTVAEREVGSFGHAEQDMRIMFAEWKFDYVKIDACGVADYTPADPPVTSGQYQAFAPLIVRGDIPKSDPRAVEKLYAALGEAARRFGGDAATLSICAWGEALSPIWGHVHGNLWRTSPDVEFTWKSMLGNFDSVVDGGLYAGPGHWNDPDMLAVGHGDFDADHPTEARSHLTMWAITAAPLLLGFDLRGAPPSLLDLVGNTEMIAIDQDAAGNQGVPYRDGDAMAVVRTLAGTGQRAVALLNRGDKPVTARVTWAQLGFAPGSRARVRDIWARADRAPARDAITATLPAHGALLLRVQGVAADPSSTLLDEMPARVNIAADGLTAETALPMGKFPARIAAAPDGTPLTAAGRTFAHGIGLFANSRIEVRAGREYRRFVATPLVLGGERTVRFRVYADRKLVKEVAVAPVAAPRPIEADVAGAEIVELVALDDGARAGRPPMIGWGDAGLRRR